MKRKKKSLMQQIRDEAQLRNEAFIKSLRKTTDIQNAPKETVNHPPHYKGHPSGVECIQITEHMNFNLGNALKYIWRCDLKKDAIEDLKKAAWYLQREIELREKQNNG